MVLYGIEGFFWEGEDSLRLWIPHALFVSETTLESSVQ